ncbi:RNA polymerase sigma-70 factor [Pedobacter alluvionis]|uniref:RNA polymerase sigma-70 factor n=1 Tax=Pedobacter alluvionis TaxID=475253 RepID=A0A497Y2W5_9SPHI|nr:RNA polymerase sigma-70 factor [Pedobacter alluvionis]RLJ77223.1 RNA polymerase sigma-70 factor (ECF subfamily) [Pedobacter alluvionis]TFB33550.1 RNA polymerase sigma-70 factor [Pedobacter alluvionis]
MAQGRIEDERKLIEKIVEGDEQAFSVLFFKYLPVLHIFATKFTKSDDAAEEIIQDAFLRVWLNRDKLAEVDNVKAYLYKYVSNECLSYLRKKLKEDKVVDAFTAKQQNSHNNTVETINLNEVTKIIAIAVDKLPDQRRNIYQLSRRDGKTIPEIAEILNISPNTVKNALVIALKSIRIHLDQHGIVLFFPIVFFFLRIK